MRQVRRLGRPDDPTLPDVFEGVHAVGRDDLVDDLLAGHLVPLLVDVWARGWSPIDLVHAIGQRFDTAHADLVAAAVLHDPALQRDDRPQAWTDQLATLRQRRSRRGAGQADVDLVTRFQLVLALARLPEVALLTMKGNSKASIAGKRPAE